MGLSKNKMAILSIKSPACVDDYIMSINSLSPPSHLQQMILASAFKSQGQKNKKIKINKNKSQGQACWHSFYYWLSSWLLWQCVAPRSIIFYKTFPLLSV